MKDKESDNQKITSYQPLKIKTRRLRVLLGLVLEGRFQAPWGLWWHENEKEKGQEGYKMKAQGRDNKEKH